MHKLPRNRLLVIVALIGISLITILVFCYSQAPDQPAKAEAPAQPAVPEVIMSFTETNADTPITRDEAVKITSGLLGIEPQASCMARLGLATDNTVPFLKIADRLSWEIVFENLAVTFPGMEGPKPEFSTITCLLDARTGALLKVSTIMPAIGAVYTEKFPGKLEKALASSDMSLVGMPASQLAQVAVKPLIPLLMDLEKREKDTIQPAKHLVAYFGLFTDRRPARNIVIDRPADRPSWIVMTGGLHCLMPTTFGDHYATDAQFVVDACSGKPYFYNIDENYR